MNKFLRNDVGTEPAIVLGFKGTDSNMSCKTFKYTVGETYTMNKENLIKCAIGFHFCPKIEDVFSFYYDKDSRFFEVEASECLDYTEKDNKIVCAQIKLTKEIFPYDVNFPNHKQLMFEMCKLTPYNLKWIPAQTKTPDFLLDLIKANPLAIEYIDNPSPTMMMEAVSRFPTAISLLPKNVSDDIKMKAVSTHWFSINYITSPSESIQFEAVYNDLDALNFIDKPTDAVKKYVKDVIDGVIPPIPPGGIKYDGIYLNEICGGKETSEDDWVELINTTNILRDMSGVKLVKNGSSVYTFPIGTVLQPKSLITVSSINDGMFSISNTKDVTIELESPKGQKLDTFIKSANFPGAETIDNGHPIGGSYARIPDGTGTWVRQEVNTIGEMNSDVLPPQEMIRINELCGALEHADDDWAELYNMSSVPVDISGYMLIKDGSSIFKIPDGTIISPKGFVSYNNIRDAMFKISNSKSIEIKLESPDGLVLDVFDKDKNLPQGSRHEVGGSYSRAEDGTGDWEVVALNTIGKSNTGAEVVPDEEDYTGLKVNEVCISPINGTNDWVEIYNSSDRNIKLDNCSVLLNNSNIKTFPEGSTIASKERIVVESTSASIVYKNVLAKLASPSNLEIDMFDKSTVFQNYEYTNGVGSYIRYPDGSDNWAITYTETKGTTNVENTVNPKPFPNADNYANLVLNEICGGDTAEIVDELEVNYDWVEVFNNGDSPCNLYGLMLYKDGSPIYVVTDDVVIEPSTYKVFGQKEGDFTTGISNSKQVSIEIMNPYGTKISGFDKTVDIDATASHPIGGSYSRIPNAVGDWVVTAKNSKGLANVFVNPTPPEEGPYANLVLNEVCGGDLEPTLWDDGITVDNDDWVEIYNKGNDSIDLSDVVIMKDGLSISYSFPSGSSINGGEYIVISRAKGQLLSGISNGTKLVSMGIYTTDGEPIDVLDCKTEFTTVGHPLGGSYARTPNGTGAWVVKGVGQSTKGLDNDAVNESPYNGLVLNEICGYGTGESLDKDDWVELYNNSDFAIDLSNLKLLYSNNTEAVVDSVLYTFPSGVYIAPKGFKVIDTLDGNISNVKVISLKLVDSENAIIDMFDRSNDSKESGHKPGGSYSRIPNGTGVWIATDTNTKGISNPETYTPPIVPPTGIDYSNIILNEICGGDLDGNDWVEIYNKGDVSVDISGLILKKDNTQIYKVPNGTNLGPNEYLVWGISEGDFSNGISSSKAVKISLHSPDGPEINGQVFQKLLSVDDLLYGNGHINGGSYARIPNGDGEFVVREVNSKGEINV